ncbi:MAG: hypothetical protein ACFCU3_04640 [Verrucomicrobiales bacterium]
MQEPDLFTLFIEPLEKNGIDSYMIGGSVAAIEFGEPRATLDIDVAILLNQTTSESLASLFPLPDYYCPPADVIELELARPSRGHFNLIHTPSGLKADFYPSTNHPLFPWAYRHRQRKTIGSLQVWFAPPEYVILWKLDFYREGGGEKHLRDIRGMLTVSENEINRELVEQWTVKLRLQEEWARATH